MGRPRKNPGAATAAAPQKKIAALEGLQDILGETDQLWAAVLRKLSRLCRIYGFERVEPPLLEDFRLYENFYRTTPKDILGSLKVALPKGGDAVLRANFLPSVLRMYYEHKVAEKSPLSKWA